MRVCRDKHLHAARGRHDFVHDAIGFGRDDDMRGKPSRGAAKNLLSTSQSRRTGTSGL